MKLLNQKGFTLNSVLVIGAITGIALLLLGRGYVEVTRQSSAIEEKSKLQSQAGVLMDFIIKVGRGAGRTTTSPVGCRITGANFSELECDVHFQSPIQATNYSTVRFRHDSAQNILFYERLTSSSPVTWTEVNRFSNVTQFVVCDNARMQQVLSPTTGCPLLPDSMNDRSGTINSTASRRSRFFRVSFTLDLPSTSSLPVYPITLQSAFYIRNPLPNGSMLGWGSKN